MFPKAHNSSFPSVTLTPSKLFCYHLASTPAKATAAAAKLPLTSPRRRPQAQLLSGKKAVAATARTPPLDFGNSVAVENNTSFFRNFGNFMKMVDLSSCGPPACPTMALADCTNANYNSRNPPVAVATPGLATPRANVSQDQEDATTPTSLLVTPQSQPVPTSVFVPCVVPPTTASFMSQFLTPATATSAQPPPRCQSPKLALPPPATTDPESTSNKRHLSPVVGTPVAAPSGVRPTPGSAGLLRKKAKTPAVAEPLPPNVTVPKAHVALHSTPLQREKGTCLGRETNASRLRMKAILTKIVATATAAAAAAAESQRNMGRRKPLQRSTRKPTVVVCEDSSSSSSTPEPSSLLGTSSLLAECTLDSSALAP